MRDKVKVELCNGSVRHFRGDMLEAEPITLTSTRGKKCALMHNMSGDWVLIWGEAWGLIDRVAEVSYEPSVPKPKTKKPATKVHRRKGAPKLTEDDVRAIRVLLGEGLSQSAIGRKYNVSANAIYMIAHRINWAHLK